MVCSTEVARKRLARRPPAVKIALLDVYHNRDSLVSRERRTPAMGFPVGIEGSGTGSNLSSKWCREGTGNGHRAHIGHSSVWSPCEATRG